MTTRVVLAGRKRKRETTFINVAVGDFDLMNRMRQEGGSAFGDLLGL